MNHLRPRTSEQACELDRLQPPGGKRVPRGSCYPLSALLSVQLFLVTLQLLVVSSLLLSPVSHSFCFSSPFPSLSSYLEFAGFSQAGRAEGLGLWGHTLPSPTLSSPNSGNLKVQWGHQDQLQGPKGAYQPTAGLCHRPEGTSRRGERPSPQSSPLLTSSSLCLFSESVRLQPGSPGTAAARLPSFSA